MDYLNSRRMFRHDPAMVTPDPNTVTMTCRRCRIHDAERALALAGGMPIGYGGADAESQAPENDPAPRDIWFDSCASG